MQNWKMEAIRNIEIMVYTKIFLKFPYSFWPCGPGKEFFIYAHERRGYYTFWQVGLILFLSVNNDIHLLVYFPFSLLYLTVNAYSTGLGV